MVGPVAAAVVAVGCAAAAWLVGDRVLVLRLLPAGAALAAVAAAVLLRRWDRYAGRRVSEADARRASAEWRADERQAELEEQLDEAREQRRAAERRLRAKRAELAGLRTEHAALLRRYATAETERARALEGRRQLAIEAAAPARAALTSGVTDHRTASGAPTSLTYLQADEALRRLKQSAERQQDTGGRGGSAAKGGVAAEERTGPASGAQLPARRSGSDRAPARRAMPGGDFDFFGNRRRAPQPSARRPSEPAEAASDEEGDQGGQSPQGGPVPAKLPPTRRSPAASAGQVIDLATEDSGALDITELRGAVS
ncbi:MAG TPA: hypothetical protein VFH77_09240 [Streptomyces sp.]|nr:hypothetical protein [Streptomyces sp.]